MRSPSRSTLTAAAAAAALVMLLVAVSVPDGLAAVGRINLSSRAARPAAWSLSPDRAARRHHRHRHRHRSHHVHGAKPAAAAARRAAAAQTAHVARHAHRADASAHIAGDPAATISDFEFAPAALTIQVGDTVTWTNNGPSEHTATAKDGSFDTGVLKKGASASHTFTQAGTFAYVCSIHPFMHGTIVVQASTAAATPPPAASSATPSGGSSTPTAPGGSSAATTQQTSSSAGSSSSKVGTLPLTGMDIAATLSWAAALFGTGLVLRRCAVIRRGRP